MLWWPTQRDMLETQRPEEGFSHSVPWCLSSNPPGSQLKGSKTLAWATSLLELNSLDTASGESFTKVMPVTFHNPLGVGRQRPASWPSPKAPKFQTLAAESGWNEQALMAVFQQKFNGRPKDELVTWELLSTLEDLYDICIRLDTCMHQREFDRREMLLPPVPPAPPPAGTCPSPSLSCPSLIRPGHLSYKQNNTLWPVVGSLAPEHAAMEDYIRKALELGFIHQSSSPAEDYCGLNAITMKDRHPLPLTAPHVNSV
ncbi:hypothetical protein AOLI_G00292660 [Acnodon oligacanthus]